MAQCYLESKLKLMVNSTKTHIAHSDVGIKFLGVVIYTKYTHIQKKKVVKLIWRYSMPTLHDDLRLVNVTEVQTGITVPELGVS